MATAPAPGSVGTSPAPGPVGTAPAPGAVGTAPAPGAVGSMPRAPTPVGAVRAIEVAAREIPRPPIGAVVGLVAPGGPVAVVVRAIRRAIGRAIAITIVAVTRVPTPGLCGRAAPG